MKTVNCNRLLVNDTSVDDTDILALVDSYAGWDGLFVENGFCLWESIAESVNCFVEKSDQIIIPGQSASIFLNCSWVKIPESKKVLLPSVKRKLQWLTPRGISMDEEDLETLGSLQWERVWIIDDVIASWTTINWLTKRAQQQNIEVYVLAARRANDLRRDVKDRVFSACTVDSLGNGRAAINTLSSLRDPIKWPRVLDMFWSAYWEKFREEIEKLFIN